MRELLRNIEDIYMNDKKTVSLYFISVASTLSGIHPQTISHIEQKVEQEDTHKKMLIN